MDIVARYSRPAVYIGVGIFGIFLLEHVGTITNTWWIKPSVPLEWMNGWAKWIWKQIGRAWASFYIYFDFYWTKLMKFLQLEQFWKSASNVVVPTFGILFSPFQLISGFYNVTVEYAKPHVVPIGLSLTALTGWYLIHRFGFNLYWFIGMATSLPVIGWLLARILPRAVPAAPPGNANGNAGGNGNGNANGNTGGRCKSPSRRS
jgi:hypothetical protein